MKMKNVGKALLFGAVVGTATYTVQKLLPAIVDGLGCLKAAWCDAMDELEAMCLYDDVADEPVTLSASTKFETGPTVAETLGSFLGISTEKARKLLETRPDEYDESDDICEGLRLFEPGRRALQVLR